MGFYLMFCDVFANRNVLITGHTGFKGSWLSHWLLNLGANVHGFALRPQPHETLYDSLQLQSRLSTSTFADICDFLALHETFTKIKPDFVFHLAAQPLVRLSYEQPSETLKTNVLGTINLLEVARLTQTPCSIVIVTTDKCYENKEWVHAYREEDALGGHDPYSASKACAELITNSYRRSFFSGAKLKVRLASARAGNVIGGGDWSMDRILPDVFRAVLRGDAVRIRNKHSTRPWQHVLEPLSGYLWLGAKLANASDEEARKYCTAYNFGPNLTSNRTVLQLVQEICKFVDARYTDETPIDAPHEASKLNLSIEKAFHELQWTPAWNFEEAIEKTVTWYTLSNSGVAHPLDLCQTQIEAYCESALRAGSSWASNCTGQ